MAESGKACFSDPERYLVVDNLTAPRQLVALVLVLVSSAGFAWIGGAFGLWWFSAFSIGLGVAVIITILRTARHAVFDLATREIQMIYAVNALAPSRRQYRIEDWDRVGSALEYGENAVVRLYLASRTGSRLVLKSSSPTEKRSESFWNWGDYGEPEEIGALRERIAREFALTDSGYRAP